MLNVGLLKVKNEKNVTSYYDIRQLRIMPSKSVMLHLLATLRGYQNIIVVSSTKHPNKVDTKNATVLTKNKI
jgi:hypothetical protein